MIPSKADTAKVIAYFQRPDGVFERNEMFRIDYEEAIEPRIVTIEKDGHVDYGKEVEINGTEWSLEPPPEGAKIVDRVSKPIVHPTQVMPEQPKMTTSQVRRKIRTGVAGAP